MLKLFFCIKCFHNLSRHGEYHRKVYQRICENYIFNEGYFEIDTNKLDTVDSSFLLPAINYLERKSYLLSTECSESSIRVIPIGLDIFDDSTYQICFEKDLHAIETIGLDPL